MAQITRWYISPKILFREDGEEVSYSEYYTSQAAAIVLKENKGGAMVQYNKRGSNWMVTKILAPAEVHESIECDDNVHCFNGETLDSNAVSLNTLTKSFLGGQKIDIAPTDTVRDVINKTIKWHEPSAGEDKTNIISKGVARI